MNRAGLAALFAATLGGAAMGQPAAVKHSVVGVVARESGEPLENAEVWLVVQDTRAATARTDETGHFLVGAEITGAARLMIRRLGYRSREVPLEFPRDTLKAMLIMLEAVALPLAPIDVESRGDEVGGWLRDFNERRRANRFGRFMTYNEVKRANKPHASELLRTVPGTTLMAGRRIGNLVRFRGCQYAPMIWIDGVRVPLAEFDDVVLPEDIAGLEIYTSAAGVPAQFTDRSNSSCGTIVIWTRHR